MKMLAIILMAVGLCGCRENPPRTHRVFIFEAPLKGKRTVFNLSQVTHFFIKDATNLTVHLSDRSWIELTGTVEEVRFAMTELEMAMERNNLP